MNWILRFFGKSQLLKLVWKIFRKVFGRLYKDMYSTVQAVQLEMPDADGFSKSREALRRFIAEHDEPLEWRWVLNVLLEIAVGELKNYQERV